MNHELIDLRSLQVFVTFCDYLNMSKTANVLHLTQPAVSHHISEMEKHLKTALVDREVRPMQLTQAGKLLKQRGIQHLMDLNTTRQLLLNKKIAFIRELKLGISELLADLTLEIIAAELMEITGTLTIETNKSSLLFEKLLNRELDIIITSKSADSHPDLTSHILYQEPVICIYNCRLGKKLKKNEELQNLLTCQVGYVEFLPALTLGTEMKRYFYRLNAHPRVQIKTDSAKSAVKLVNDLPVWGIGIPLLMSSLKSQIENVRYFSLPQPLVYSTWHLIYRKYESEKPAEIIKKIFKKLMTTTV
jgi:DNA-binding transcriptional LysR family regulator